MAGNLCYEKNKGAGQRHVDAPSILNRWPFSSPFPLRLVAIHFSCLTFSFPCSCKLQHGRLILSAYGFLDSLPCLQNTGKTDQHSLRTAPSFAPPALHCLCAARLLLEASIAASRPRRRVEASPTPRSPGAWPPCTHAWAAALVPGPGAGLLQASACSCSPSCGWIQDWGLA